MSLYAVTAFNHVFSRAAALSPSVWVSVEGLEELIRRTELGEDTVIYMDYGQEELGNHRDMLSGFWRVAEVLGEQGASVSARLVPWGSHSEASWERQLPIALPTILYDGTGGEPEEEGD